MLFFAVFLLMIFFVSLFSSRLKSSIITMPMIFMTAGMVLQLATPETYHLVFDQPIFLNLAVLALVLILFSDSARIGLHTLRGDARLPLRLLTIGLLMTILLGAISAKLLFPQLSLGEAGVLAAILAPTDAGLGSAIVQSPHVPVRIRRALNVEAGLNDGLAVPFLMLFIAVAEGGTGAPGRILVKHAFEQIIVSALIGIGIGLAGGWLLGQAHERKYLDKESGPFGLMSIPLLCLIAAESIHSSAFIAAFIGGLAVQVGFRDASSHVLEFSEQWGQLLNFLVFFSFGIIAPVFLGEMGMSYWIYAIASLTVIRMVPTALALMRTRLNKATVLFMGWFGPRGLASLVLGLVFLEHESKLPGEPCIRSALIATVLLSVFAHGLSTRAGIRIYSRVIEGLDAGSSEIA